MRRVLSILIMAAAVAGTPAVDAQVAIPRPNAPRLGPVLLPGDPAPPFAATDIETRGPVELRWDEAKLTLVQFYAEACEPCRLSLPVVEHLWTTEGARGFRAVAVLMDATDRMRAKELLKDLGTTFPVARATVNTYAVWGGIAIVPMTFLVGQDGKIVRKYIGADVRNLKAIQEDVVAYLDGRPVGPPVMPAETERVTSP